MLRRAKSPAGFTMVELLVALGLTIFLLALFTTLMVAATGSINTSQGIGAVDQHVRNAITTLRDDLQKIYLAHDGTPLAVSQLFTGPDKIPTEGYFLIEENDRAIRQGLDAAGIPVEVDTDDVLAFTFRFPPRRLLLRPGL
jgi:type II secretory pathway pseudopilin PulG